MNKVYDEMDCPYCDAPIGPKGITRDYFFAFIDELKERNKYDWDDVNDLLYAVDLLLEINSNMCIELAKTIKSNQSNLSRMEFYRKANELKEVK
jgi:hypothetical protein